MLEELGFTVLESFTNFLFITHPKIHAAKLEKEFKARGILTRYYQEERISNFLRVTIGSEEDMNIVVSEAEKIIQCLV